MLRYKTDILAELKKAGWTTVRIRKERIVGESALQKMRTGDTSISLGTLEAICDILQCQPGNLIEWVPNE